MDDGVEEAEFVTWVSSRHQVMWRTALHLCAGDRPEAEELLQETLIRLFGAWSRIRDREAADAYSRTTMVRLCARRAAQARRSRRDQPDGARDQTTSGHDDGVAGRVDLQVSLRALPERQRTALVLRYLHDMSEAEAALVMGCSRGSVKSHLHRAVRRLRDQLSEVEVPTSQDVRGDDRHA